MDPTAPDRITVTAAYHGFICGRCRRDVFFFNDEIGLCRKCRIENVNDQFMNAREAFLAIPEEERDPTAEPNLTQYFLDHPSETEVPDIFEIVNSLYALVKPQ